MARQVFDHITYRVNNVIAAEVSSSITFQYGGIAAYARIGGTTIYAEPSYVGTVVGNAYYYTSPSLSGSKVYVTSTWEYVWYYTITVLAGSGGTATGGGEYASGTRITIKATPNSAYYKFSQWSDGNTSASRQITVDADATYTAYFVSVPPVTVTLSVNTVNLSDQGAGGTVSGGGQHPQGSGVAISATPNQGFRFVKWSDGNTSASRTITANTDVSLTATFVRQARVEVVASAGGSVQITTKAGTTAPQVFDVLNPSTLARNGVYIKAIPSSGYVFDYWSPTADLAPTNDPATIGQGNPQLLPAAMSYPAANRTYTANFRKICSVSVLQDADENIEVWFTVGSETERHTSANLPGGTQITLHCAIGGYTYWRKYVRYWQVAVGSAAATPIGNSEGPEITVTTPASANVVYSIVTGFRNYAVRVADDSKGKGTVAFKDPDGNVITDGAGNPAADINPYNYRSSYVILSATPAMAGEIPHKLGGWHEGSQTAPVFSTSPEQPVEVPAEYSTTVWYASFIVADVFPVDVAAGGEGSSAAGCSVEVVEGLPAEGHEAGWYYEGTLKIRAVAAAGWELSGWTIDGVAVPESYVTGFEHDTDVYTGAELPYRHGGYATGTAPHAVRAVFGRKVLAVSFEEAGGHTGHGIGTILVKESVSDEPIAPPQYGVPAGWLANIVMRETDGVTLVKFEVVVDGVASDMTEHLVKDEEGGHATWEFGDGWDFAITGNTVFRAHWGGVVRVSRRLVGDAEPVFPMGPEDIGLGYPFVGASRNAGGPYDFIEVAAPLGETVWLRARDSTMAELVERDKDDPSSGFVSGDETEVVYDATASHGGGIVTSDYYFAAWFDGADTTLQTPLRLEAGPDGSVAVAVAQPSATYCAAFTDQETWTLVKLECAPVRKGTPVLRAVYPSDLGAVEEIGEDDFKAEAVLLRAEPLFWIPDANAAHMQFAPSARGVPYTAYYKIRSGTLVELDCEDIWPGVTFSEWSARKYYIDTDDESYTFDDLALSSPETLSSARSARFMAGYHMCVTAALEEVGEHRVTISVKPEAARVAGCEVSMFPEGRDAASAGGAHSGTYNYGETITLAAMAATGYSFDGWFEEIAGGDPELVSSEPSCEVSANYDKQLFAKFARSEDKVLVWEGSGENKTMVWRSRMFTGAQPLNLVTAAVYADGYPEQGRSVKLITRGASSPNDALGEWRAAEINLASQDPRRLPMRRPEKYVTLEVRADAPVVRVAASTSMQGLAGIG